LFSRILLTNKSDIRILIEFNALVLL
jgi:hypothetical protein